MTTIAERKKIAKLVLTINDENIINKIKSWNKHKAKFLKHAHIKIALERLKSEKWI